MKYYISILFLTISLFYKPTYSNESFHLRRENNENNSESSLEELPSFRAMVLHEGKIRPRIHTFFFNLGVGEHKMLDMWKRSWYESGWIPVVLNLNDAKRHPLYYEFETAFKNGVNKLNSYNKMCYYRWLAMASVGGGWMSDLDLLPINISIQEGFALPNNGIFTGHAEHVPCLVSGSKLEWNRMCKLLLESYIINNHKHPIFSDMFALLDIRERFQDKEYINLQKVVLELEHVYIGFKGRPDNSYNGTISKPWTLTQEQCLFLQDKRAMHFSHDSTNYMHFDRLDAIDWVRSWRRHCLAQDLM